MHVRRTIPQNLQNGACVETALQSIPWLHLHKSTDESCKTAHTADDTIGIWDEE